MQQRARQILRCINKLFDVHADWERQAKREKTSVQEAELPRLWILSPTASVPLLDGFRAIVDGDNWMRGVYFLGDYFRTAVVAIHQLPRTFRNTLAENFGQGGSSKTGYK